MKWPSGLLRLAARVKPAVPDGLLNTAIQVSSMVTDAPLTQLPTPQRALVVAPPP